MTPTPRDDETARMGLEWLREDLRDIRGAIEETKVELGRVAGRVEDCARALDNHISDPKIHRTNSSTTITPPSGRGNDFFEAARRWAPVFLAVAIGLLGLGAYVGQASTIEAKVQKMESAMKAMQVQR